MSGRSHNQARRSKAARPTSSRGGGYRWAGSSWRSLALSATNVGVPLLLIGALAWPLLFTKATFNEDWLNHLWYMWHQSLAIRANHLPSLFLNYSNGVFYPYYAFYGGTLYALTGALSLALGNTPLETYILTYILGLAAAYGGWYWMSRIFGLHHWLAHIPGLVFVTSASYLMLIYGFGDWPEFLAVSSMPLMIAAGLSVLSADRLRILPAIALVGSSIVFFGSHLLTTIWGSTILIIVGLAILVLVPEARRGITRTGLIRVIGLVVPALLVSAWFLLPAAAYESRTAIAASYPHFRKLLQASMYTVAAKHLFTLSRGKASDSIVTASLPTLAIVWVLVSLAISSRSRRTAVWMKICLIISGATVLVAITMTHAGIILALPRLYATLQFAFRLESYVLLGVSGAVLAALVLGRGGDRRARLWNWMLVPIALISVIGAITQTDAYKSSQSRNTALSSYLVPTFESEGLLDYVDDRLHVRRRHLPQITFPPDSIRDDRASKVVHERPGQLVDTNIRSGPELVQITGARIVGIDLQADDVLEIGSYTDASGRAPARRGDTSTIAETISIGPADGLPVAAGRLLTEIAVVVLALELGLPAIRRVRRGVTRRGSTGSERVLK